MEVETLGDAFTHSWRIKARCAGGVVEPRMPGGPIFGTGSMTAVTSSRYSATGLLARSTNSSTSLSDGEGTLT
jgi:hypothetical protein